MKYFEIDKKLLPVKAHYFLLNGAHAGVIPFIPVYAQQLGISASAVGVILAILSCLTVISKATFGGIVDYFQKLKQVILFLILVDIASDLGLNFIPKPFQEPLNVTSVKKLCYEDSAYLFDFGVSSCQLNHANFTQESYDSCFLCHLEREKCLGRNDTNSEWERWYSPDKTNITKPFSKNSFQNKAKCTDACFDGSEACISVKGTDPPLQLYLLSIFTILVFTANGAIVSVSDAACYNALRDQPQNFGKQRMWGTIGWGTFGFFVGFLNQMFTGTSKIYNFSSGFYMLVALYVIDLFFISKLSLQNVTLSKNIFKDVGTLLVKPKILLFIATMYGIGIATGMSRSYMFWYLRTTLGGSQLVLGCAAAIQCFLGELPFFFFSGLILSKFGHMNTFTMAFMAYGVRFLIHSFLTNPWWAVAVEILQGPCFGSFYSAMTSYSKIVSPKGTEATVQGIVSGTFEGLGVATGSLLGGFCISNFGGRGTFFWSGLLFIIIGFIHWLVQFIKDYKNKDTETATEGSDISS